MREHVDRGRVLGAMRRPAAARARCWSGQVRWVMGLRKDLRRDLLPVTLTASVLGGVSGAVVLLNTKQMTFLHMVPWLVLVASLLFGISGPVSKWIKERSLTPHE